MAPGVCMVRTAAARKFGLSAKRVKEPFLWFQLIGIFCNDSYMVTKYNDSVTLLLQLWLSFHSVICAVIVMLVDSSGKIINLNKILALSKLPLR